MYHYPCASGGGCFQDIKTLSLLCKEHIDQAQDIGECFSKFVLVVLHLYYSELEKPTKNLPFRQFGNSDYQIEPGEGRRGPTVKLDQTEGLPLLGIYLMKQVYVSDIRITC